MTQLTPLPTAGPLVSDRDVTTLTDELVGPAIRQQLWLLPLDADRRPMPMLIPIDGAPMTGPDGDAHRFAVGVAGICDAVGGSSLVLVWERPGDSTATSAEQRWISAVARAVARRGVPVTAQVLAHDRGTVVLHVEERAST